MCGNYLSAFPQASPQGGSPPRVRELHGEATGYIYQDRITPACAGITSLPSVPVKYAWDHPRVCGNYLRAQADFLSAEGSPPRVRELLS